MVQFCSFTDTEKLVWKSYLWEERVPLERSGDLFVLCVCIERGGREEKGGGRADLCQLFT